MSAELSCRARRRWLAVKLIVLGMVVMTVACGGRIAPRAPAPARPASETDRPFIATAYCTGRITAAGSRVDERTVAADPDVLPLGTLIRVAGLAPAYNGVYKVLDTGPKVQGRRIDLYMRDCSQATKFGRRPARVVVVRRSNRER